MTWRQSLPGDTPASDSPGNNVTQDIPLRLLYEKPKMQMQALRQENALANPASPALTEFKRTRKERLLRMNICAGKSKYRMDRNSLAL